MTTLVLDNFTGTDATALASHTVAPTNTVSFVWTVPTGTITIQTNRAQSLSSPGLGIGDSTKSDVVLTGVCRVDATGVGVGMVARETDVNNYWMAWLDTTPSGTAQLYENNASVFTVRASTAIALSANTDYTIVFTLNGTSIDFTTNGANQLSYTSTFNQTATKVGLKGYGGGANAMWDSLQVADFEGAAFELKRQGGRDNYRSPSPSPWNRKLSRIGKRNASLRRQAMRAGPGRGHRLG